MSKKFKNFDEIVKFKCDQELKFQLEAYVNEHLNNEISVSEYIRRALQKQLEADGAYSGEDNGLD